MSMRICFWVHSKFEGHFVFRRKFLRIGVHEKAKRYVDQLFIDQFCYELKSAPLQTGPVCDDDVPLGAANCSLYQTGGNVIWQKMYSFQTVLTVWETPFHCPSDGSLNSLLTRHEKKIWVMLCVISYFFSPPNHPFSWTILHNFINTGHVIWIIIPK